MKTPIKSRMKSPKKNQPRKESFTHLIASSIITTPCEKVLTIIQDAINFIQNFTKDQYTLISNLEWAIEIISSRSLYSYEIKEKEKVNKLSQENPEFKELVDFVSEYNEKVIKMNKFNSILTDKLLLKPSINLNKKKFQRKSSFNTEQTKLKNYYDKEEQDIDSNNTNKDIFNSAISSKEQKNLSSSINEYEEIKSANFNKFSSKEVILMNNINKIETNKIIKKKQNIFPKKKNSHSISINESKSKNGKNNTFANEGLSFLKGYFNPNSTDIKKLLRKKSHEKNPKNKFIFFPSVQKISITINNNESSNN